MSDLDIDLPEEFGNDDTWRTNWWPRPRLVATFLTGLYGVICMILAERYDGATLPISIAITGLVIGTMVGYITPRSAKERLGDLNQDYPAPPS